MNIPELKLKDQNSHEISYKDIRGQWTLIYFYPKDGTPLCIKEACNFRDGRDQLQQAGLNIIGISADNPESHKQFADEFNLQFTLLSDQDNSVLKAFGSVDEKEYLGVSRDSYLVNPEGEIVKKYTKIDPDTHFEQILEDFRNLNK